MYALAIIFGWVTFLTLAALYFFIRGNHHKNVINHNAANGRAFQDFYNGQVDLQNQNNRSMRVFMKNTNEALDTLMQAGEQTAKGGQALTDWVGDLAETLTEEMRDTGAELARLDHGIDAVNSRMSVIHSLTSEQLNQLRSGFDVIIEALKSDDAGVDTSGGKIAAKVEEALGYGVKLNAVSHPAPVYGPLPREIQTQYGPAFLAWSDKFGNCYIRPRPDGEPGNYVFSAHGEEIALEPGREYVQRVIEVPTVPDLSKEDVENFSLPEGETSMASTMDELPPYRDPKYTVKIAGTEDEYAFNAAYFRDVHGATCWDELKDGYFVGSGGGVFLYFNAQGEPVREGEACDLNHPNSPGPSTLNVPALRPLSEVLAQAQGNGTAFGGTLETGADGGAGWAGTGDNQVIGGDTVPPEAQHRELEDIPF